MTNKTTNEMDETHRVLPLKLTGAKVAMGQLYTTRGVKEQLAPDDVKKALMRHAVGDWGECCAQDWSLNDEDLVEGNRLLSVYRDEKGTKFWIITEADRSATTVLLPEEY